MYKLLRSRRQGQEGPPAQENLQLRLQKQSQGFATKHLVSVINTTKRSKTEIMPPCQVPIDMSPSGARPSCLHIARDCPLAFPRCAFNQRQSETRCWPESQTPPLTSSSQPGATSLGSIDASPRAPPCCIITYLYGLSLQLPGSINCSRLFLSPVACYTQP